MEFFDDSFSSRSSFASKDNIVDDSHQMPLITLNKNSRTAKDKAHRTSTFKDISYNLENEENLFQMFKKVPTIKEYERL